MYFTFRDGLIVRQENYDCFHLQESGDGIEGGASGTDAGAEGGGLP
jgi:hypothetical protein